MLGKQNYSRRHILALGLVAVVIVFILWNVREVSFLLYPFRLFVTYVHEAGHGSAAILTGGELRSFEIFAMARASPTPPEGRERWLSRRDTWGRPCSGQCCST
ncbi:MAG: M50 family metallopeptidase [Anaerolineae bacterium]|nr:M50 family metallopeptidase [Anaerolineae bacterium]